MPFHHLCLHGLNSGDSLFNVICETCNVIFLTLGLISFRIGKANFITSYYYFFGRDKKKGEKDLRELQNNEKKAMIDW